jgi:hypothetical protein
MISQFHAKAAVEAPFPHSLDDHLSTLPERASFQEGAFGVVVSAGALTWLR